jgi:hypothetical protein
VRKILILVLSAVLFPFFFLMDLRSSGEEEREW